MAQPTQLTPTEQDALVKQIGLAMLRVAPDDWEQLTVDYRAVGRYSEATGRVVYAGGGSEPWTMPPDLQGLFARLRGGMYRDGRGTWFNARYRLDHPSSYNLEYDREEPAWEQPPPPAAYAEDMRLFPRTEENVPEWLRRRLAAAPPPRFRVARIFDGPGEGGRPAVHRPPLVPADAADVLAYLDGAPVVGPPRGYDTDRLDPEGRPAVPVAFHTDGTWIWPAAVNYYLREHDVPPEPDLVDHIMRSRFQLPPVDEPTRAAAAAFLGAGAPPPRMQPPAPGPTRAMPVPPPPGMPVPPPGGHPAPPPAALPSQGPPARTVDTLRARLDELGIPPTAYRIGPPAGRAWTMDQTEEGWRVGWFDREFVAPAMFEDVADASAFLLGKLLLDADRWQARPPGMPVPPAPVPPPPANPADFALAGDPAEAFLPPGQRRPDSPAPLEETQFSPPLADAPEPDPMPTFQLTAPGGGARVDSPLGPPAPDPAFNGRTEHGRRHEAPPEPQGERPDAGLARRPARPDSPFGPGGGFEPRNGRSAEPRPDSPFAPRGEDPESGFGADNGRPPGFERPSGRRAVGPEGGFEPRHDRTNGVHGARPAFNPGDQAEPGFDPHGDRTNGRHGGGPAEPGPEGRRAARHEPSFGDQDEEPGFGRRAARPDQAFAPPEAGGDRPGFEPPAGRPGGEPEPEPASVEPGFVPRSERHRGDSPGMPAFTPPRPEPAPTLVAPAARPVGGGAAPGGGGQEWPITPMPGEPPLTLFRGKRMIELEPGTEFDRFGEDDGNLVYVLGTPFQERSLVPDWVERPYHAYRVRQPVQVLTGSAIPWFDQPGGGTAYLLPDSVGELLASGQIMEISGRERPPA